MVKIAAQVFEARDFLDIFLSFSVFEAHFLIEIFLIKKTYIKQRKHFGVKTVATVWLVMILKNFSIHFT